MRLELRVSGGVAGVRRPPVAIDTGTLDAGAAAELEALAARVTDQGASGGPPGPDRFQYDLLVDGRAVRLHEGALSPEAAALIRRMGS